MIRYTVRCMKARPWFSTVTEPRVEVVSIEARDAADADRQFRARFDVAEGAQVETFNTECEM